MLSQLVCNCTNVSTHGLTSTVKGSIVILVVCLQPYFNLQCRTMTDNDNEYVSNHQNITKQRHEPYQTVGQRRHQQFHLQYRLSSRLALSTSRPLASKATKSTDVGYVCTSVFNAWGFEPRSIEPVRNYAHAVHPVYTILCKVRRVRNIV